MKFFIPFILMILTFSCSPEQKEKKLMTVSGPVPVSQMGRSLIHEHILVDFIGADSTGYHRWNRDEVFTAVKPYLEEVGESDILTLFDCTPAFLGRDPLLLRMVADSTGLQIITNTGLYGAVENKYLPAYTFEETADQLAARWIREFEEGIENTGVRPGFIKISVAPDSLSPLHEKLVRAAARTHLATGLTIASHTGPALPAFQQLEVLKSENVSADAFVWVHAQNEKGIAKHVSFARQGGWVSIDGLAWGDLNEYLTIVSNMKDAGLLNKVLLSHDAGWYSPGESQGGEFRSYTTLTNRFIPLLLENGFTREEIDQITIVNPQVAFGLD